MYAYVDESGNTGNRIFDPQQPLFITAATLTKSNFDLLRARDIAWIAKRAGVNALHANELGVAQIDDIAGDLLKVIKQSECGFFLSRVEKSYLAAVKVFDTYFDPCDNKAVPWQSYNVRPLRLMLTFKIAAYVLTEEIAALFWEGVVARKEAKTRERFLQAAEHMLANTKNVPDARSRQVIADGFEWALANSESFSVYTQDKINRNMHSPNFVAFTGLMHGIEAVSRLWKSKVREIVHDKQTEFEKTFKQWHEVIASEQLAKEKPVRWFGEEAPMLLAATTGSKLHMANDETSAGLQVTDVVLWLFKRVLDGKEIGPQSARLMNRVFQRARQSDFSFEGVGRQTEDQLDAIMNRPMSEEQLQRGHDFIALSEMRRQEAMEAYLTEKAAKACNL